ncbi:hypothetical protein O6H91_04G070600 [Diphasiastrum complanatum]|uniref:Uncharacterized protein n=8 Tax=Diphasiastrum complanatum TaxID=34168 RepID=A0ACC2DY43_DIPCM|nr:hypothetical protein O6H91_04G070500 [Diphasiastrum complanatum]KAJ7559113.1 hypothetical protein O6H91_04G070500 [Diphasiastrum complanatum]KAJ7559114.1 hypothetical protein O6H91_04G070600 [Diphasiastrum complanatum]KAJ7559115.1 hypothetical protein O6H91_04G070600 [Diphasiastrum complanatum]KAJ7559116.1 hypothetical protein O6H91_04G070600 [Diphasiastrum complanatum]
MAPSMKYWDDWVEPDDMQAMWSHPSVLKEWIAAGELKGQKVHISRNPDGQPYLTHVEMRAVADIVIEKHFKNKLDPVMVCAIAEIESNRQPLAYRYEPKLREASTGLMQMWQSTVDWLFKDLGYEEYSVDWTTSMLYKPFVSVYFGVAYLKWLSTFENKRRSEEFMVRAYGAGPKDATSKLSQTYWDRYLGAKQTLPSQRDLPTPQTPPQTAISCVATSEVLATTSPGRRTWIYWDEKTSGEDMNEMWRRSDVKREWIKSGEKPGKVRFSLDSEKRPYLTKIELKAVAEIIVWRHFAERGLNPAMLCTIADISSQRLLFGPDCMTGIMQLPFSTALWLYTDVGYKSYRLKSIEDLTKPFVSMYFGAAYICWLSHYDGRSRSDQFVVQAYRGGPQGVDNPESGPFWLKYMSTLPQYLLTPKTQPGGCSIQ